MVINSYLKNGGNNCIHESYGYNSFLCGSCVHHLNHCYTGRPWMNVKSKIKKEYPAVQYTAWTVWFLTSFIPIRSVLLYTLCYLCYTNWKVVWLEHTNVQFWPVVGWINHRFLPLQLRVVFQSLVAFAW